MIFKSHYAKCILLLMMIAVGCRPRSENRIGQRTADTIIRKLASNDVAMSAVQPGDWLDEHSEPGQSFDQYKKSDPILPTDKRDKIYLQPLGHFSTNQQRVIVRTAEYLNTFFNLETIILPELNDVKVPGLVRRLNGSEQLQTWPILNYLITQIPKDGIVLMAVTSKDLYPDEKWNFVFGQASTKNRVGVSSIFRYSQPLLDSINYTSCLRRLIKTSSHEISHMFSCAHCTHAVCVMNGSNSLPESDTRPNRLCSECLQKLQWNLGFDVRKRAIGMSNYFARNKLWSDCKLAVGDLKLLQGSK